MVPPTPTPAAVSRSPTRRAKVSVRRCLCPVLCLASCLFLLPLMASILLHELHLQHQQQAPPWQALEPATLSQLRRNPHLRPALQQQQEQQNPPDGYFNGVPVYLHRDYTLPNDPQDPENHNNNKIPHSSVHCVGENYEPDAWMYRSCHFHMLCYDLQQHDLVLFRSHREQVLTRFLETRPGMHVSGAMMPHSQNQTTGVALGGINQKWQLPTDHPPSSRSFKWFPRVLNATPGDMTYYALPSNTVLVPYHSLSAKNPGHLVWDDFLPIYTLLTMFQLQNRVLLPLRITLPQRLWSSCEMSHDNEVLCQQMTLKFAPLLVGRHYPYNITTADQVDFTTARGTQPPQSNYVCAPRGAAGSGALTDHGTQKLHGWMRNDYKTTHNHGRGALLYEFRNFMLQNLGLPLHPARPNPPYRIVFSLASSDIGSRNLDFDKQIQTIQQNFAPELVQVEAHVMKELSVVQQVQLASETAIFITICGGGAVTGMFLPKGASVILYYLEHGGVEYGVMTGSHAHLDWDLFNHLSHVRAHWMPTATMDNRVNLRALVLLIQQELDLIQSEVLL